LTQVYRDIAEKIKKQQELTPAEQNFIAYEAVQLMPIEPTVEYRGEHELGHGFFIIRKTTWMRWTPKPTKSSGKPEIVKVTLKKPDTENWGYDIVIFGCSATNPSVLETLRPDELVEFIETLHNFPTGPIKVIYDIVYGHADNQAMDLLNGRFLKGPNMYGQDMNHQNPTVRAILLEMQRRKNNTGASTAFGWMVRRISSSSTPSRPGGVRRQLPQRYGRGAAEYGDHKRRLFAIFEDGRPWPAEGWEEISTYRDIVEYQPDAFQWGPLIFAHNTPSLTKFWDRKWRRVVEQTQMGANWITGCGNHDTLRRGTQVDPELDINWNLGDSLPEVLEQCLRQSRHRPLYLRLQPRPAHGFHQLHHAGTLGLFAQYRRSLRR
jgi:hypothetical protein